MTKDGVNRLVSDPASSLAEGWALGRTARYQPKSEQGVLVKKTKHFQVKQRTRGKAVLYDLTELKPCKNLAYMYNETTGVVSYTTGMMRADGSRLVVTKLVDALDLDKAIEAATAHFSRAA